MKSWPASLLLTVFLVGPVTAQPEAFTRLQEITTELAQASAGMSDEEARRMREQVVDSFSTLAMTPGEHDGVPLALLASRKALEASNLLVHRHRRIGDAKGIAEAVESLLNSLGQRSAALQAATLRRKLEILEQRASVEGSMVSADLDETPAPPPFLWPLLYAITGIGGLIVLYLLVFRRGEDHGIKASDAQVHAEADKALRMGLKLLKKGRVEQSVKYFEKVAHLESVLRGRGNFFIALARLETDDIEGMDRTLAGIDFAAVDKEEAYALADVLERKGLIEESRKVFEKLYITDIEFRDVKTRLDRIRREAEKYTGSEIAEMVQQVIDPRFDGVKLLGTGGMGFVYEANDREREGVRVAVKVLSPFYVNVEEAYTRFIREASGISQIEHPNLVRIFDVFKDRLPYYSMEFLTDRDLKDVLLERGRLDPAEAVAILRGICAGLGHAHRYGITHRDMKPANVLVLEDDQVKVIDFGIAKFEEETQMTVTGQVMGTPLYMSPEQVKGMEIDLRSDIYSVGVMAYEMLTGNPPFETMMERGLKAPPPFPPELGLPPGLEAAVMKSLEKLPEERYQDLQAFADALAAGVSS